MIIDVQMVGHLPASIGSLEAWRENPGSLFDRLHRWANARRRHNQSKNWQRCHLYYLKHRKELYERKLRFRRENPICVARWNENAKEKRKRSIARFFDLFFCNSFLLNGWVEWLTEIRRQQIENKRRRNREYLAKHRKERISYYRENREAMLARNRGYALSAKRRKWDYLLRLWFIYPETLKRWIGGLESLRERSRIKARARDKRTRQKHQEQIRLRQRKWRKKNAQRLFIWGRKYRAEHREQAALRMRLYREKHPDKKRAENQRYTATQRQFEMIASIRKLQTTLAHENTNTVSQ